MSILSEGTSVITEGKAKLTFSSNQSVFYNPVQEFNRDISIAVIRQYIQNSEKKEGFTLLEGLSASGLRSIRYAKEIPGLASIIANDWSAEAIKSINANIITNDVSHLVTSHFGDASTFMSSRKKDPFDIVDLDPYGSPTGFLDSAVQCLKDGGLLCVTATDMAVLCGNSPETCHAKYGSLPLKHKSCHEMALRILLNAIERAANRYGRFIEPLLSLSIDFYIRVFVKIQWSPLKVKESTSKMAHVFVCHGCETLTSQPLGLILRQDKRVKYKCSSGPVVGPKCEFCNSSHHMGGPFWIQHLHDKSFVRQILEFCTPQDFGTHDRLFGMLSVVEEELDDVPFYYTQDRLFSLLKLSSCKMTLLRSALLNHGYAVSLSHCNKQAIKTNAPSSFIWDMMRCWAAQNSDPKRHSSSSVAFQILSQPPQNPSINFEHHVNANPSSREKQLKRFQVNPLRNWGPKTKASVNYFEDNEKQKRNQGRKRKMNSKLDENLVSDTKDTS